MNNLLLSKKIWLSCFLLLGFRLWVEAQEVTNFTLVNADTDQDIGLLTNNGVINLATLPTKNLNIRVNTNPQIVGSVSINLNNGNISRIENVFPYALNGDNNGNYLNWTPALGNHTLTAKAYSEQWEKGNASDLVTISFKVIRENSLVAPSNLSTNVLNANSIRLNWLDNSSNEGSFVIESANSANGPFSQLATVTGNTTKYTHSGLTPGQSVWYRVKAITANRVESAFSNIATATTPNINSNASVISLILINADNNQAITELSEGQQIDISTLASTNLSIEAILNGGESVRMDLSGALTYARTESVEPYALFGDDPNPNGGRSFIGRNFIAGNYNITATPYSFDGAAGDTGTPLSIKFSLVNPRPTTYNVTLTDDGNGSASASPNGPYTAGTAVTLTAKPDNGFEFSSWTNGSGIVISTNNPYTFNINSNQNIRANFTTLPSVPAVASFTLINALNEQEIMTLSDGANIDLNNLPTDQLNIRANTSGDVESVTFQILGTINETSTESTAPYALFGDNAGDYYAQTFSSGDYKLTAKPYTQDNAQGQVGTSLSINFTFSKGSGGSINNPPVVTNPGDQTNAEGDNITLSINANDGDASQTQNLTYSASGLPPGLSINPNTGVISGTIKEPTAGSGGASGAFLEDKGLLMVEAESEQISSGWVRKNEGSTTFYEATENNFNSINILTNLDYSIKISTPGIYRVIWRSKINVGTNATEHNDNWLKLPNSNDVTFFAYKGAPSNEAALQSAINNKKVIYPRGSGLSPNPAGGGADGFFKIYMNSLSGWQWRTVTSDNNPHDVYVKFDKAGTYTLQLSSRSAGHAVDRIALYKLDTYGYNYNRNLNLLTNEPESLREGSGSPGASLESPYNVVIKVTDNGSPAENSSVNFIWHINETNTETLRPPSNLATSQITSSSLLLSWTGSSFGDTYIIEQSTEPNSGFSKVATVNWGTNQSQISNLQPNTTYYYRVYTESNGATSSASNTVSATTSPQGTGIRVVSLTLIDTDKNVELGLLKDGDTINYAEIGTSNISVVANTDPGVVGSVRFSYDNTLAFKTESLAPYSIRGDANGKYNPWTPALGSHKLVVTPFTESGAGGNAGTPLEVNFTVIDDEGNVDPGTGRAPVLSGEFKKWHKLTISFFGPESNEQAGDNPFTNYRLNVTFKNGNKTYEVPGYFAADGQAGETSASSGNVWRVHFTPDAVGEWSFSASFRKGANIAISDNPNAGEATDFNGQNGTFTINPSDKTGKDFRARGRLNYVGEHYLQFEETGEYFLKGGADSPENFLAYKEFDGTYNHGGIDYTKTYNAHIQDWTNDSPTWKGGKGKGIIGALNYLASKGMNSVYFLTMNVNGDGKDIWPWTSHTERYRFDVSKLDQWEVVFSHMEKLGIMMHVLTQETENDRLLDGGYLGDQRKLYYRELIARFGHHLAVNWNLGEENDIHQELPDPTNAQLKAYATYFKNTDPYQSYINVHTYPGQYDDVYDDLIGYPDFDGASLQIGGAAAVHRHVTDWISKSAASGRKWVVNLDEIGPADVGVAPDNVDFWHDHVRKQALWGALMGGAGGVEWYFGYKHPHSDLTCQDWRTRDNMWNLTRYALEFFQSYVPYWNMTSQDALTSDSDDYCFANPGQSYLIYLPNGGSTNLDFGTHTGNYSVLWFNPRTGESVQDDNITVSSSNSVLKIGNPPSSTNSDWTVLIRKDDFAKANASAQSLVQEVPQIVFPNPASYHTGFLVNLAQAGDVRIRITGIEYLVMDRVISNVPAGEQAITIQTNSIADGAYTFTISYPGEEGTVTKSGRLLIQH